LAPAVGPRIHAEGKWGIVAGQRWIVGNPIDASRSFDTVGRRHPTQTGIPAAETDSCEAVLA